VVVEIQHLVVTGITHDGRSTISDLRTDRSLQGLAEVALCGARHTRSPLTRTQRAYPRRSSPAAPRTGWSGAHRFRAPETPIRETTSLLQIGHPTANNESAPPAPVL